MYKSTVCILFLVIYFVNCKHSGKKDVSDRNIRVIPLPDGKNNFLAALVWDAQSHSLYAVDFISPTGANSISRWDRNTKEIFSAVIEGEVNPSFIWPVEGCKNQFIVGLEGVLKLIRWNGISKTATVIRSLFKAYGHMNYALADRAGRLYFGTLNYSSFCSAGDDYATYLYDKGSVTTLVENTRTTTGIAIDYKREKFYLADACDFRIDEYDYDQKTGDISNGRLFYDFKKSGVYPYPLALGLNVDKKGRLYVTLYKSGQMWVFDCRSSKILHKVKFPSPGVSDVVFAGPKLNEVYVISTRVLVNEFGGGIAANRTQDTVFFRVKGLNACGYETPRIRLGGKGKKCH